MLLIIPIQLHGDNMAKETLHMKIDAELKQELKRLAEAEHRNLSNLIEKVLIDYVGKVQGR